LLQQDDIWQAGKNFWRDDAGGGVDQGLARVRWRDRVGENPLARMERFGSLAWERFGDVATRAWSCGLGRAHGRKFQRGKIIDWTGPGKLEIFKRRIFSRPGGKIRPGCQQKNEVPQGGSDHGSARDATFDPAIPEKFPAYKFFRSGRAGDQSANAASDTLVEAVPANFKLRVVDQGD